MRKEVLAKIAANKLTPQEGYDILYGTKSRKGRFVRMRINIAGHPFLNFFSVCFFCFRPNRTGEIVFAVYG